jgi:hypothetical protein
MGQAEHYWPLIAAVAPIGLSPDPRPDTKAGHSCIGQASNVMPLRDAPTVHLDGLVSKTGDGRFLADHRVLTNRAIVTERSVDLSRLWCSV